MKKLMLFFGFLVMISSNASAAKWGETTVNAYFTPSTTTEGSTVQFVWSSTNAVVCFISGVPGINHEGPSGTHSFTATQSIN